MIIIADYFILFNYMYGTRKMPKKVSNPKPSKKKSNPKMISESMMKKLKEHSKLHKGGMSSKHMKNMMKFVKMGDSFSVAHNKAKKLD